ncbi:immunoglobulin superfamily containing leucine-rich repeat protein 2-like [Gouania willdenowi]|uniref:Immunoglobulin superfamily containing leucine-rich repeat protein 2-like n=1 Tax=Gouania willdenowi TaxID=441366 RepID=A0A8C5G7Z9_GOUWI|nr:immunoglobulin superfamily containing leucine-rich repeat protein 2-like [Gouania willdenowi]
MQKMEAVFFLWVTLWTSAVFPPVLGCPELCTCSNKYSRPFAECSFKDLSQVPDGFPPNVTTIGLSANKIGLLSVSSFDKATGLMSLWLSHNKIAFIERGTFAQLLRLRNLDISHNKIVNFPWGDLHNLTGLHLLKINHNEMSSLPRDAFDNQKELRSLRLNNNKFVSLAEGTFDGLVSLSHLQIAKNPFACTCSMEWFRDWISTSTISIPDKKLITCATPKKLNGQPMGNLAQSKCISPEVIIRPESNDHNRNLYEDTELVLTCEVKGNPKPEVTWSIHSKRTKLELPLQFIDIDSSGEFTEDSMGPVTVFNDGTLLISNLRKEDSGKYKCFATNELGSAEDFVTVKVVASPQSMEEKEIPYQHTDPSIHQTTKKIPASDLVPPSETDSVTTAFNAITENVSTSLEKTKRSASNSSKCGLTANTRYVSDHNFSTSLDDIRLLTFDFGVIVLGVSETEARVRLNHRLIPQSSSSSEERVDDSGEKQDLPDASAKAPSGGLYLCAAADQKHSAVQWSKIKDSINTYLFSGLRPATNYSLCLTYREEDCEVQVMFTTRRRVTNLLIIVSVSIFLLTISTVPLLAATCFHLVYKYRSKTYRLILKAKNRYHVEGNLTSNFRVTHTKLQRRLKESHLDEEKEGDSESGDGEKEAETEESVVTDSLCLSQCRVNLEDCEAESESSDRLPLGAEAVNLSRDITSHQ